MRFVSLLHQLLNTTQMKNKADHRLELLQKLIEQLPVQKAEIF
jgi:hypothetical protein